MKRLIMKATSRWWNELISAVLCRAYSRGVIDSAQLHILTREFDPTQDGYVTRKVLRGGSFVSCAFETDQA